MPSSSYAVVAYLTGDLGKFVSGFRAAVTPHDRHLRPHLTALPPRKLQISDADAVKNFQRNTAQIIEIKLGDVCTFRPVSPTIYLDLRRGQQQIWQLSGQLGSGPFAGKPDWPFAPHLTLAKLDDFKDVPRVLQHARDRWRDYQGTRGFSVTELTLVREADPGNWLDLASIHAAES
jgi:2'-5' RNA ligase